MVQFDPQKATASIGLPLGKQELLVKSAKFGMSKTNKPMVTIELTNTQGITGNFYLVPTQFSDNTIQRILASAQSCGASIPMDFDFQVDQNLAGFIQQRVRSFFVNVKEDANSDFPKIASFMVKPADPYQTGADAFNPFEQQAPAPTAPAFAQPQAQPDLFGATPATPQQQQENPFARDPQQSAIDAQMAQAFPETPAVPPVTPPAPTQPIDVPNAVLDNLPFDTTGLTGTGAPSAQTQQW